NKVAQYVKIWFTTGGVAATSGPVIGGLLIQASWRWLFLVNIPVVVIASLLTLRLVPRDEQEHDTRLPDLNGGALLIIAIAALNLGLVKGPDWGWGSARIVVAFAMAAAGLLVFVARSARHTAPVVELSLLRDRVFTAANLVALLSFASFGVIFLSQI